MCKIMQPLRLGYMDSSSGISSPPSQLLCHDLTSRTATGVPLGMVAPGATLNSRYDSQSRDQSRAHQMRLMR